MLAQGFFLKLCIVGVSVGSCKSFTLPFVASTIKLAAASVHPRCLLSSPLDALQLLGLYYTSTSLPVAAPARRA